MFFNFTFYVVNNKKCLE